LSNPFSVVNPTVTWVNRQNVGPQLLGPVWMDPGMILAGDTSISTLFWGVGGANIPGQYNATSQFTSAPGSGVTIKTTGINRMTLASPSPNLLGATLTAQTGILATSSNAAFGPGSDTVQALSGGTIGFRQGLNYFTPQTIASAGQGADIGN